MTQIETLEEQIQALESTLGAAGGMVQAFEGEVARMGQSLLFTGREAGALSSQLGSGLRRAFEGVAFDGGKLSDALGQIAKSMAGSVYTVAMKPVQTALGGAMSQGMNALLSGLLPFAEGAAFTQGRVTPFAKGGVVTQPVSFPMRSGTGLMGEAGPEAIMPLTRGADGRLGVQAAGGTARPVSIVMNIQTPDVPGFQRSQSQIAAQAARALARGQRNR